MDKKMSSTQYFNFVNKQLAHETVEQIISTGLMNLSALIFYYLPEEQVLDRQKQIFETLMALLSTPGLDESLKAPIVDNMFSFVSAPEHVQLAVRWLETSFISASNDDQNKLFELNKKHKFSLLKVIFKDSEIPLEKKNQLLESVMAGDTSDLAQNARLTCEASLPCAEAKAKVW